MHMNIAVKSFVRDLAQEMRRGAVVEGQATGIHKFDWLRNGLGRESLTLVTGIPKSAKTALLTRIAISALAVNRPTAIFLGRDSPNSFTARVLAALASVDLAHIQYGHVDEDEWSRMVQAAMTLAAAPFSLSPAPRLGKRASIEIERAAYDLALWGGGRLGLVLVDDLDFASIKQRTRPMEGLRELQTVARAMSLTIVATVSEDDFGASAQAGSHYRVHRVDRDVCISSEWPRDARSSPARINPQTGVLDEVAE